MLVVGYVNEGYVAEAADGIYQVFEVQLLMIVHALAGFVEYEQGGVFDERPGQQA